MQTKPKLVFSGRKTGRTTRLMLKAFENALEGQNITYSTNARHLQDWYFNKAAGICRYILSPDFYTIDSKTYTIKLLNGGSILFTTAEEVNKNNINGHILKDS